MARIGFSYSAQRSIYVLVLDATRPPDGDGETKNRLGYWLRMLSRHGSDPLGKAPVIVLISQCDNVTAANQGNYNEVKDALDVAKDADWYGFRQSIAKSPHLVADVS